MTEQEENAVYKEMYIVMMQEMEKAINILIAAQQRCEEMYINAQVSENGGE